MNLVKTMTGQPVEAFGANKRAKIANAPRDRKRYDLTAYPLHKQALVDQLQAVLVRHGNGKSKPEDADYANIATTVWKQVQQAADDLEDGRLTRLELLSEKAFCEQSRKIAAKWWNQAGGKGDGTSTQIKQTFKDARIKGAEELTAEC